MPENTEPNLWQGSEYVRERGVLICLHSTYEYTTQECIQHFHDRDPEWFDYTFGIVIDWVICQKGQSREQAMAPLAITNFYEKVLRHIGQAPSGFKPSQAAFRRRLALLQPKVVLLACEDKYVLEDGVTPQFVKNCTLSREPEVTQRLSFCGAASGTALIRSRTCPASVQSTRI
jgi:hypothetical protein